MKGSHHKAAVAAAAFVAAVYVLNRYRRRRDTHGIFHYQSTKVPCSLTSTGNVYVPRQLSGSDLPPVGLDQLEIDMPVRDARADGLTLHENGVALVAHAYDHIDYYDEEQIVTRYYDECCRLVEREMGAVKVYAFDHNLRAAGGGPRSWMNKATPVVLAPCRAPKLAAAPAHRITRQRARSNRKARRWSRGRSRAAARCRARRRWCTRTTP